MPFDGVNRQSLALPSSYAELEYKEIKVAHVPAGSPQPTAVLLVTLFRPKNYNAFTLTMMKELEHIFTLIDVDDRVKAAVVTGDGRMFCAGADLSNGFTGGKEDPRDHRDGGGRVVLSIHRCRKPIIGALNGSAVGIGITMTLPMTIRIAYEGAKIGFVFARRAIIMEACSSFFLPRLIGWVTIRQALHSTDVEQNVKSSAFGDYRRNISSESSAALVLVQRDTSKAGGRPTTGIGDRS